MSYLLLFDHYNESKNKKEGEQVSMFHCEPDDEDTLAEALEQDLEAMRQKDAGKEKVVFVRRGGPELKPEKPPEHERTFHNTKR